MRPSFLLTPDAFTRGEGVGSPTALIGAWPVDLLQALQNGAHIRSVDTPAVLDLAPRAALLFGRLNGERLDRFLTDEVPTSFNEKTRVRTSGKSVR